MNGGVANDEFRADDNGVGGAGGGGAAELFEKAAGGLFAHFFAGVADGGELGLDDPRDGVIIESYDSNVFRYAKTGFFQRLQEYSSKKIIGDEDSVGAGFHGEYLAGRADGGCFAEIVNDEQGRVVL